MIFAPSISAVVDLIKLDINGKYLAWWTENSIFSHNAFLVSAYYGMKYHNLKENLKVRDDVTIVSDSGGFQVLTQNWRVEPIDLLKWQESNSDVAMTLDVPCVDPKTFVPLNDFSLFKKCTERTCRYLEIEERNRENYEVKMLNVIHGANKRELDYWFEKVKNFNFDGYALAPKPSWDPMSVALHLAFINDRVEKTDYIHVLLGTGHNCAPIIAYASRDYKQLTTDNSTFSKVGRLRQYFLPFSGKYAEFGENFKGKLKKLPCNCPVCSSIKVEDLNQPTQLSSRLLFLHNLWINVQYFDFLDAMKDDEELFFDFVRTKCSNKAMKGLEFLRYSKENGFDKAYNKFFKSEKSLVSLLGESQCMS